MNAPEIQRIDRMTDFFRIPTCRRISSKPSLFKKMYLRNDLPVHIVPGSIPRLCWHKKEISIQSLLPVFVSGLVEPHPPLSVIAFRGCLDLLDACKHQEFLPELVPVLVPSLKRGLESEVPTVVVRTLQVLTVLIGQKKVLKAMLPFVKCLFIRTNKYLSERLIKSSGVSTALNKFLEDLANLGGQEAIVIIRYSLPLWDPPIRR